MGSADWIDGRPDVPVRLYHGSDVAIEHPDVSLNTGFSDLGQGFYLTDDYEAARRRSVSRARRTGSKTGVVSVFDLNLAGLPMARLGELPDTEVTTPFGLCFAQDTVGIKSWIEYIAACRRGATKLARLGDPAVVRAWIATEEVEMACSGLVSAADVASFVDVSELVAQYCLRDQSVCDARLSFVGCEVVNL